MTALYRQTEAGSPFKDRLLIKLTALFIFAVLAVLMLLLFYDMFVWRAEAADLEAGLPLQPAVQDIDPKIEAELAKVLILEETPNQLPIVDPFIDRGSISGIVFTTNPAGQPQLINAASTTGNPGSSTTNIAGTTTNTSPGRTTSRSPSGSTVIVPGTVVNVSTKDRLEKWRQRASYGYMGEPDSTIFAIEDLIPVGVVNGGDMGEEVIFYSSAADRTLSFPVGTRFYDGWLVQVLTEGVVFGSNERNRTTRVKSWGRSLKTGSALNVSTMTYDDQAKESQMSVNTSKIDRRIPTGGNN